MDGGQPLDGKKLKTAQERAEFQIKKCLSVEPENQFIDKIFPPICLQVFITTLRNMGVLILQADYEADDEIAAIARELGCIVISEDTDFFMTDVEFVRLSSVSYKSISKKKYIPCRRFNRDAFCDSTGVNKAHLPLLGTLLANDYVDREALAKFHKRAAIEMSCYKPKCGISRALTIKSVIHWMAKRKNKALNQVLEEAVGKDWNLKKKVVRSIKGYTLQKPFLLDCIPFSTCTKDVKNEVGQQGSQCRSIEYTFGTEKQRSLETSSQIRTALVLKNGEAPPHWFVKAYRENRIPHEVADILTQGYFFSPAQVECTSSVSSYLVVEPIVRLVYTFLWKGCQTEEKQVHKKFAKMESFSNEMEHLSVGSDDSEDGSDKKLESTSNFNVNESKCENSSTNILDSCSKGGSNSGKDERLCWYIRKKKSLWSKHLSFIKGDLVNQLPTLKDVGLMTSKERKVLFYKMVQLRCEVKDEDYPADLELISNIIKYWYKNTKESLQECHALTVLVSFFLFHKIDSKIGRVRTWKGFENVESCKEKLSQRLQDPAYCKSDLNEKDLIANISYEECLIAGSTLFRYHHIDKTMNRKKYKRKLVHDFSEYQSCVYFFQLLNSLLCFPFPFLSVEYLWGGTFGYNVFIKFSGSQDRLLVVREIFGQGTCLERLFCMIFSKLEKILKFSKPPVDKRDKINSSNFGRESERTENQMKNPVGEKSSEEMKEVRVEEVKVKVKTIKNHNLGNNRFSAFVDDSDTDEDS
ncbi:protein asteroid isoform X2 [Macrobrachium rosenbergii]